MAVHSQYSGGKVQYSKQSAAGGETLPATLGCTHRFFLDDNPRAKICGTFCPGPRKYLKFTKPVQGSSRSSNQTKNAQAAAVLLNRNAADGIWADARRAQVETYCAGNASSNMICLWLDVISTWCTNTSHIHHTHSSQSNTLCSVPQQTAKAADAINPLHRSKSACTLVYRCGMHRYLFLRQMSSHLRALRALVAAAAVMMHQ